MVCGSGKREGVRKASGAVLLAALLALALSAVEDCFPASAWGDQDAGSPYLAAGQAAGSSEADPFAGGSGTEADPFVIQTADQLAAFRDAVNAGDSYAGRFIELKADLDLGSGSWVPIGASVRSGSGVAAGSTPFSGTFSGGGHRISGLTIAPAAAPADGADYASGLFGAVMGGTVKDLVLENVRIDAPASELAGGAVGLLGAGGMVSGVTVSGSIKAKCGSGGIVGRMVANGTIAHCTNDAAVTVTGGSGNCGGIVGAAYYVPEDSSMAVTDCINNGTITGVNDTGGIAGLCCASVSGCVNNGNIEGSGYAVGGIAGELKNHGGITHCTNRAPVANGSAAKPYGTGGIVGWVRYDGAPPAYALSAPAAIADNLNSGSVEAVTGIGVGGIAGVLYSAGTVTGNQNEAPALSGSQFIGGIVGNLQDQGAATLPESVPEGARVTNNVSTTTLSAMEGALKDAIAYNNDPSIFTVEGNGGAWVARRQSTGGTMYASLPGAFASATDGDTVTLIADTDGIGPLKAPSGFSVTLDLNGHDVGFSAGGGFLADGGVITVAGMGDVYARTADGAIDPAPDLFSETAPVGEAKGRVLLEGGLYPFDVSAYAAPGYRVVALSGPDALGNRFEVVAEQPAAPVTPDKPTVPETPAKPGKTAVPDEPSARQPSDQPVLPGAPSAPASLALNGKEGASQMQASTGGAGSSSATIPQTSDPAALAVALTVAVAVLAAAIAVLAIIKGRRPQ